MSDIHALSGAYAIDALDDVERARFERHLVGCTDCRAEVESLQEAAALLPAAVAVAPPAGLRDRVLSDIDTVRPLPPVVPAHRPRRRIAALVAAAAAIVAIGGVGITVWQPWSDDTSATPSAVDAVFDAPDAEVWSQRLDDGGRVTVARSDSLDRAAVRVRDMSPAGDGRDYQLWLQHGNAFVSAGLLPDGSDVTALLEGDSASAEGFGITREPDGGSPKPTRPPVALIAFV